MPAEYVIRIAQDHTAPRGRTSCNIEMEAHKIGVLTAEEEVRLQQVHTTMKTVVRAMQRGAIRSARAAIRLPPDLIADAAEEAIMDRHLRAGTAMGDISELIRKRNPEPVPAGLDVPADGAGAQTMASAGAPVTTVN
jgi:hypothetical protein